VERLETHIDPRSDDFTRNHERMATLVAELRERVRRRVELRDEDGRKNHAALSENLI
jgi:hypothetical protein